MWYCKTCNIALPPRPEVRGIPRGFGDAVAAITKTEDRQHYLDTVSANPIATKVKICDMMANMQQCLNDEDDNRASYYCTKLAQLLSKTVKSSKS